jgi:hypothetical protein
MQTRMEVITNKNEMLDRALVSDPHLPYRRLRFFKDAGKLQRYYRDLFFGQKGTNIFSGKDSRGSLGLLTFNVSDWDSAIFGIKMAKIGYLSATGGYASEFKVKDHLLTHVLKHAVGLGVKFLSTRVEADDFSSIHALEGRGFRLMDCLMTYACRFDSAEKGIIFPGLSNWFSAGVIGKDDLGAAGDLFADRYTTGHYSSDPFFTAEACARMYRKWLENLFKDKLHNDILVAKRQGKLVGCSMFSFNKLLERHTGLRSVHRGLIAVDAAATGCAVALFNEQLKKRKGLDFAEFETQSHNYAMTAFIQKVGMSLISSRYTFHKML